MGKRILKADLEAALERLIAAGEWVFYATNAGDRAVCSDDALSNWGHACYAAQCLLGGEGYCRRCGYTDDWCKCKDEGD